MFSQKMMFKRAEQMEVHSFRLALGSTQLPIKWEPGALSPGGKATGA
jgi:hypothetical protein